MQDKKDNHTETGEENFAAVMKRIRADSLDKFIDAATPSMNCDAHARRASCLANCPWKANHRS